MSYSTIAEVRLALAPSLSEGELTHTAADLTDPQLQDAIAQADSMIDSFIGATYTTPVAPTSTDGGITFTVTPHPVDFWSRDIAAYLATLTYRKNQDLTATDPIQLRYNMISTFLLNVQNGKGILNLPQNANPQTELGVGQVANPYTGDLFGPSDWDLVGTNSPGGYPTPGVGGWSRGYWNERNNW